MTELLLLIFGAAVGLIVLYLVWSGLSALSHFLEGDDLYDDDGEW